MKEANMSAMVRFRVSLLLLVFMVVAPVVLGAGRQQKHKDERSETPEQDHPIDEARELERQEVRDESKPDDEIEESRRHAQGRGNMHQGDDEEDDVVHFHELEPSMLGNRSSAHHDLKDYQMDFNPMEGILLPRLTYEDLFHAIDTEKDGRLTVAELADWIAKLAITMEAHSAAEQWNQHEKATPDALTWEEFESVFGRAHALEDGELEEETKAVEEHMRFIHRRWKHCDRNGDGALSFAEFIDFQYPEERPHLQDLRFEEQMERFDTSKDGRISLNEFLIHMHAQASPLGTLLESAELDLEHFDEHLVLFPNGSRISAELMAEVKLFMNKLDEDGDRFLNKAEARTLIVPQEYAIPEQAEAQNIIRQFQTRSRKNKKKVVSITLDKFLEKRSVFQQSSATNFGQILVDEETQHDEL